MWESKDHEEDRGHYEDAGRAMILAGGLVVSLAIVFFTFQIKLTQLDSVSLGLFGALISAAGLCLRQSAEELEER